MRIYEVYLRIILSLALAFSPAISSAQVKHKIKNNGVEIGDGANTNKNLIFKKGETLNPEIRYNSTEQVLEFTNDGTNFAEVGSGSGSGSGGINLLKRGGFETGTTGWTVSGGTLSVVVPPSALWIYQKKSGVFQASATGQYLDTELVDIPPALAGKLCSFRGLYSGTPGGNLKIQVLDESSNLVLNFQEKVIYNPDGVTGEFMQTFTCPTSGKIKGRFVSTASTGQVAIDEIFLGEAVKLYTYGSRNVGDVFYTAASSCPIGSVVANGNAYKISDYLEGYAKVGTTYGDGTTHGNGSASGYAVGTAFNVANAQAISLRGTGTQTYGGVTYSATLAQKRNDAIQSHIHSTKGQDSEGWQSGGTLGRQLHDQTSTGNTTYYTGAVSGARTDTQTHGADLALTVCQQMVGETIPVLQTGEAVQHAGTIYAFAGPMCPVGDYTADGRAALRSEFLDIYANIGTSWGDGTKNPDGSSSGIAAGLGFNFPDARGLVLRGVDGTAGRDPDKASRTALISGGGGNAGNNVGSYQADSLQNITGSISGSSSAGIALSSSIESGALFKGTSRSNSFAGQTGGGASDISFDASRVARTSTETRGKNINVLYCVKGRTAKLGAVVPYGVISKDQPATTVINTIKEVSAAYTATVNEETIVATGSSAFTITLPDATLVKGKKFILKNSTTNSSTITVAAVASQTIDGSTSALIEYSKEKLVIQSTGSNWVVLEAPSTRRLVKTYSSGTDWYEVYNDGWVKQGFRVLKSASATVVSLVIQMKDTNYSPQISTINATGVNDEGSMNTFTTSGFTITSTSTGHTLSVLTEGYGNSASVKAITNNAVPKY